VQQYGNIQERARKAAHDANKKVLTNAANMWLIMNGGFEGENDATRTFKGETDNALVPDYVAEWPTSPYSDEEYYVVTITKKVEEDESERYTITVTAPGAPGEVQD
jgi:hypothetical protein